MKDAKGYGLRFQSLIMCLVTVVSLWQEALMAADISSKNIKRHDVQKIGMSYINHLVDKRDYDGAARCVCCHLIDQSKIYNFSALFYWLHRFFFNKVMKTICINTNHIHIVFLFYFWDWPTFYYITVANRTAFYSYKYTIQYICFAFLQAYNLAEVESDIYWLVNWQLGEKQWVVNGSERNKSINNNIVNAKGYFFISRIPLPGPRLFALQMLQNCAPGICDSEREIIQNEWQLREVKKKKRNL